MEKQDKDENSAGIPVSFIKKWMEENATNSDIKMMFQAMLDDYEKSMQNP